jgi:hypothetical protein
MEFDTLKGFLILGAMIWLFYRVFESPRSRFNRKWSDRDWTYGKLKMTYQALSDPERKMEFPTRVRGDLKTGDFQVENMKPKCNGVRVEPGWHVVKSEGRKEKIRRHLEEKGSKDPLDFIP